MEYFIEINTYNKTHNLRVIAQVAFGEEEDEEFCEEESSFLPPEYDQIDIEEVYVYTDKSERRLNDISEELLDIIKEKIIKEELDNEF